MLILALVAFYLIPTMPPRLLSVHAPGLVSPPFEDTGHATMYQRAHNIGGNPYAAMPSMHIGWATWSLRSLVETKFDAGNRTAPHSKIAMTHLICTIVVVIVTANHYWLDCIAGYLVAVVAAEAGRRTSDTKIMRKVARKLDFWRHQHKRVRLRGGGSAEMMV